MKSLYPYAKHKTLINVSRVITLHYYEFDSRFEFLGEEHDFWELVYVDSGSVEITRDGEPVNLTPTEYDILKLLMSHPRQVFSPAEIYERVWHETPMGFESTVAVHIRHLREKLEIDPAHPRWIKVVWGRGYKLEEE